jgi:L-arabinose isomerase
MHKSKIGLLPLYVALYDQFWPEMRVGIDAFHKTIIKELLERNLEVVSVPVCRLRSEFIGAVKLFEKENVDAIVSLHLAYSPSLEQSCR